jgi:NCS1 family nucleobase:cation symporter-1
LPRLHYTLEILGAFIGPLFGVLIADYYLVKKQRIVIDDLFTMSKTGTYWYKGGYNAKAVAVTVSAPRWLSSRCCSATYQE